MPDILHVVDIRAKPEDVFQAVATVSGICRWWSPEVEGSDEVGGEVNIRFGSDWKVVMEKTREITNQEVAYRITQHDSDEWPDTQLSFSLSVVDEWTILKFDHRDWAARTDFFRFCSSKWVVFLLSIKQAVESGTGTPYPNETKIGRMS